MPGEDICMDSLYEEQGIDDHLRLRLRLAHISMCTNIQVPKRTEVFVSLPQIRYFYGMQWLFQRLGSFEGASHILEK
jgi:hypothetical protein